MKLLRLHCVWQPTYTSSGKCECPVILHINHILCILCILHIHFVQDAFDPAGIEFNTFPTMAKHIVDAMLSEKDGEVHKLSLHDCKVD